MKELDMIIIGLYLVGMLYLGYRLSKGNETQEDFFIGGRKMPIIPIALSIAATTMSANSFIGGPGWAYESGMLGFMNQFSIPIVLAIALTIFIPFFYNLKLTSVYEYIGLRLGSVSRVLIVLGFAVANLILVSGFLYVPSLIIQTFTGWSLLTVIPIVVVCSIAYTALGGIKAVIWTDAIQTVIYWVGIIGIFVVVVSNIDVGFMQVFDVAKESGKMISLDFAPDMNLENGVWAALIGCGFMWMQYFATDQSQVQRMFASKSVKSLKKSICISGFAMNISYFAFSFLGILLFVFYGGKPFDNANSIMIDFIVNYVPAGLTGIIIAAIFAGAMSSVDSVLNSVTTVFIKDIYEKYISKGEQASLKVTRSFTLFFGLLIIGVTILAYGGTTASILKVINTYLGYITGSILGMFLLAMFTDKANDRGSAIGFVLGIVVTALVAQNITINWAWLYIVGTTSTFIIGYLSSMLFKNSKNIEFEQYTFKGQRKMLLEQGKTIDEDGGIIIPGKFDKYTYISLGFFVVQFLFLLFLQV